MFTSQLRVDVQLLSVSNSQIAENREIVKIIFEALLYLARQNNAFRGHDEHWSSSNQGNFLELVKLLGKYNPLLSVHLSKIQSVQKNRLTFLSNVSQNNMLSVMGEMVREEILKRVKQAGVFSIIIDTTTDVSNLEQFSLVLRFINEEGQTEERLIAMKVAHDPTGLGMFNVFSDICIKYNIDWETNLCAQSYDGAASMQGQYSGVRSFVVDTCDKCLSVRNFFGEVQSLISYMRARKRTAIFLEQQTKCYPSERPCRTKNFSTTRWTSHDRALSVISKKYSAFLKTLEELINSTDRETSSTASNLYRIMTSFKFILNLFLLENIFSHTTPLSIYLQSSSIDFIQAITMVDVCAKNLSDLRSQQSFNNLIIKTKSFVNKIGLVECELPSIRSRRRKLLAGEVVSDEVIINPYDQFKIEVYYVILDQINTSIISRFDGARGILSNLSLLTFDRLKATGEGTEISDDHFIALKNWIPSLNLDDLKMEYSIFAKSFIKLYNGMNLSNIKSNNELIIESENEINSDSDSSNKLDNEE
ncbi:hypothetical protein QTP88_020691 [Uroleucon formosanum]